MSKIIEALEKARRDGGVGVAVGAVEERDTLAPVRQRAPRDTTGRAALFPRVTREATSPRVLEPAALQGVDPHVEVLHRPMSVVSEQYRALRSQVERRCADKRVSSIAVTSAVKGEGKSLTAVNLAAVLAQDSSKAVLLVDADMRAAKVHQLLGLPVAPGLAECLQGTAGPEAIIRRTEFFGLSVVTAGELVGHPAELLASEGFRDFSAYVAGSFDYVIFDCPPVFPISDVNFLTESVEGVLLVVQALKTPKRLLERAMEGFSKGKLLGVVLNRAEVIGGKYRGKKGDYGYYYAGY